MRNLDKTLRIDTCTDGTVFFEYPVHPHNGDVWMPEKGDRFTCDGDEFVVTRFAGWDYWGTWKRFYAKKKE